MATALPPRSRRSLLFLLPVILFAGLALVLGLGLGRDPAALPSALLAKPAPDFALPPLAGRDALGLSRADLGGKPMLVNIFASWCVPCRVEHPILSRLKEEGVTIQGINYKDDPDKARAFLGELGDPYAKLGADRNGRAAIEWGAYGVPETFVLDKEGRIAYRQAGPLMPRDLERTILPLLERLR